MAGMRDDSAMESRLSGWVGVVPVSLPTWFSHSISVLPGRAAR